MIHNSIKFLVTSIAKQTSTYRSFHRTAANQNFISNWIRSVKFYMNERKSPPWNHCIQIGDPVLREVATEMPTEDMLEVARELRPLIEDMKHVLNEYRLVGIAAPQIGISVRIFLMQFKAELMEHYPPAIYRAREMETLPLTIAINPAIKVTNYDQKIFPEGCASICGYNGDVARYSEIILSGYNENGVHFEKPLKGWNARIAQHEMDHLNGRLFTDIMDPKTFVCSSWEAVNFYNGQLSIPFYPRKIVARN